MAQDILKNINLKYTKNRQNIIITIKNAKMPITAKEIYENMKDSNINLSTIYRTLEILTKKGIILKSLRADAISYYQINDNTHKHYLICDKCDEVVTITNCGFDLKEKEISKETGYVITGHNIEITGICPKCSKKY